MDAADATAIADACNAADTIPSGVDCNTDVAAVQEDTRAAEAAACAAGDVDVAVAEVAAVDGGEVEMAEHAAGGAAAKCV
jgi:hypothetical protein